MNRTEPSPNTRFTPPVCLLEKSSSPPSESLVILIQLLCTSVKHGAGAVVVCHGFSSPGRVTALFGAPAQMPCVSDQARSPAKVVLLSPSVMSLNRVLLLR